MSASNSSRSVQQPLVEVLVVTYNHAPYVEQSIRSVLSQETDFAYTITVLDDCSTDGTQNILERLRQEAPNRIRLVLAEVNTNDNVQFARTIEQTPAKYVAWMDGDDYWCSPHKLQKQVNFMEAHPECPMSYHDALVVHEDGSRAPYRFNGASHDLSLSFEELFETMPIAGCSMMLRVGLLPRFPDWFDRILWADWALCFLLAEHGRILYIPEVFGVYRVHARGLWSGMNGIRRAEQNIALLETLHDHWRGAVRRSVESRIGREYHRMARLHDAEGAFLKAMRSIGRSLVYVPAGGFPAFKQAMRIAALITLKRFGLTAYVQRMRAARPSRLERAEQ